MIRHVVNFVFIKKESLLIITAGKLDNFKLLSTVGRVICIF